jgi:uncharacterized short protein YbdD (DUF466 family)
MSRRTGARGLGRSAWGRTLWGRLLETVRRVAGMPDYAAHLEHLRRCHPERPAPSEREFFEQYLRARYGDATPRCC